MYRGSVDNNELIRRLRYALQIDDPVALRLFKQGGLEATAEQVQAWRLKDEDDGYIGCPNEAVHAFLAGFIVEKRGLKDGKPVAKPSTSYVENNTVLKLMKIALSQQGNELHECIKAGGGTLSENEVKALMRKPGTRNYRECGDQALRQYINGVGLNQRDD